MFDHDFLAKLEKFVAAHPASTHRWFSTPTHNKSIGGAKDSAHLIQYSNAIDLSFDSDLQLIAAAAVAHTYGFSGIELDLSNKHLHLDTKPRLWRVVHHADKSETPLEEWINTHYPQPTPPQTA